jgi:hypothetical protein
MRLTNVERERLTDSMLKIQSIRATLGEVDESKVPDSHEIHKCLDEADHSLRTALGYKKA